MPDMKALAGGVSSGHLSQCAIVLEDEPVGSDSRLNFESFPPQISETYGLDQYRQMGGDRMPQPAYVAYRGGNWGPFSLQLAFRAGLSGQASEALYGKSIEEITQADVEQVLIEMERKVRWCQALAFPLERGLGSTGERIMARARAAGVTPSEAATEALGKLRRNDPPIVLVVFGSWWVQRGYVTSVTIDWQGPYHPSSVRPHGAQVTLQIQPLKSTYPTWNLIRDQAGGTQMQSPLITGTVN
jgi:hypothetical protein